MGRGNRGVMGSNDPSEIYLGVKHRILTPRFFGKYYFLVHRSVFGSSKIIKIVATCSCQILRLKCTKFDFGCWDRKLTALPKPCIAGFKGAMGGILEKWSRS